MSQFRPVTLFFLPIYIPVTACDAEIPPAASPLNNQSVVASSEPPEAPPAPVVPPPDFLEASRFSPKHYNEILQRLFPIDRELQKASSALLDTSLDALEDDGTFAAWDHSYAQVQHATTY